MYQAGFDSFLRNSYRGFSVSVGTLFLERHFQFLNRFRHSFFLLHLLILTIQTYCTFRGRSRGTVKPGHRDRARVSLQPIRDRGRGWLGVAWDSSLMAAAASSLA